MFKTRVHCDVCDKPLKLYRVDTPLGSYDDYETSHTKQWDTSNILPHLCKKCALEIDNAILSVKLSVLSGVS